MLKELNYIAFDFETTGVDIKKDEPIQIGIIKFDSQFNVLKTYYSFVKPRKDIKELKDIVSFITGFKLSDLENSMYFEDIIPSIKPFFDANSVLIGHNVDFDIGILSKYMQLDYFAKIDTLDLSKQIFHFAESYALEIISEMMKEQGVYTFPVDFDKNISNHDALYDSLSSYNIFKLYIQRIAQLVEKFPVIYKFLKGTNCDLSKILLLKEFKPSDNINYFLPPLKIEQKANVNLSISDQIDFNNYDNGQSIYHGNIDLKDLLKYSIGKSKIVLSFSHRSKMLIVKNLLNNLGIRNIGFFNIDYVFDQGKVQFLLEKNSFQYFELTFLIKYFSLYDKGYGVLDLNSTDDYKIFNFLIGESNKKKPNIILSTHGNLYKEIQESNPLLNDYQILYFDKDWWFQSYSKHLNQYFDFYYFLGLLDQYLYYESYIDESIAKVIDSFIEFLTTFTGVLYIDLNNLFTGKNITKLEVNPIESNLDFYKTKDLLKRFDDYLFQFEEIKNNQRIINIVNKIKEIQQLFSNITVVERKMYNQDKYYFVFHKTTNNISFFDFDFFMKKYNVLYFSNYDKNRAVQLNLNNLDKVSTNSLTKISSFDKLLNIIETKSKIFVLSSQKVASTNLFQQLFNNNIHNEFGLFVENVTGGLGKNLFNAKNKDKLIMIGGIDFYFSCIADGIKFDDICMLNIGGPLEGVMKSDILYYGLSNSN